MLSALDRRGHGLYHVPQEDHDPLRTTDPMKTPSSCGEAYKVLVKHFGTEDLAELSRLSKVSRSTLAYWRSCPGARMRKNGRAHLQRIFAEEDGGRGDHRRKAGDPGLAQLLDMFQEVRDLLARIEQRLMGRYS